MLRVVVGELLALERILDAPIHHVAQSATFFISIWYFG